MVCLCPAIAFISLYYGTGELLNVLNGESGIPKIVALKGRLYVIIGEWKFWIYCCQFGLDRLNIRFQLISGHSCRIELWIILTLNRINDKNHYVEISATIDS